MSFHSWSQGLRSALAPGLGQRQHRRRASLRAVRHRLNLEVLEERCVPAFIGAEVYDIAGAIGIVTADFNGDGKLDLATANLWSGDDFTYDVSVLLGNGDGTFQDPQNYDINAFSDSIATGDFNGDGKLDLVIGGGGEYDGGIDVLLGNGDGSFNFLSTFWTGGETTQGVAVADFDADGKLDVAVTGYSGFAYGGDVAVMLGRGDGTFARPSGTTYLPSADSVAAGDFNRDGKVDLAWAASVGIGVLFGNGDGTFAAAQYFATDASLNSVNVADLNGDGNPDLVTDYPSVLLGNGDGTFQAAQNYAGGGAVVGDFNGDGSLDLVVGDSLLPGNGHDAGTYGPAALGNWFTTPVAVGDFNGDGRWDMAMAGNGSNSVWVGLNDGIWDGPPPLLPPSLRINEVTVTEGNTGTVAANFTVTLSAASTEAITIAYATANGTATAGSDFNSTSGILTFAPGETSKNITVPVIGDRLAEPNETFVVNLNDPTNATIADGQGVGTILDDEPRVSISDVSKKEGNSGLTAFAFTVTLSAASTETISVAYTTGNGTATAGSDYQAASSTLTFAPGETSKTITVLVNGDRLGEANETFLVNLSGATNATIADSQGAGTIVDDEPRISISDVTKAEGKKGQTTLFTFTVTLSAAYDQPVTMSYRTVDGTATKSDGDYVAKSGTLTFAPGETTKTITIEVKGDSKKEANETFYLDLFGNNSNSLFSKNRGIGSILNDD
jgi:hypothetical protein